MTTDCHGLTTLPCGCIATAPGEIVQRCAEHERRRLKHMRYRHRKAEERARLDELPRRCDDGALFRDAMIDMGLGEALALGLDNIGHK